jgi:hypothetical protein
MHHQERVISAGKFHRQAPPKFSLRLRAHPVCDRNHFSVKGPAGVI